MLMTLFDDEQIYKAFENDIKQETAKEVARNKAIFMIQKGKIVLPISAQAHHSFADGLHIEQYAELLQIFFKTKAVCK